MQIGEIGFRADRTVERLHVWRELDQVSRHEPRREPEVAKDLHHQPGAVAAGAGLVPQRLFRRLDPRLHADQIADRAFEVAVDVRQKIVRRPRAPVDRRKIFRQPRSGRRRIQIRCKFLLQRRIVLERPFCCALLDEEVEGIDDGHVGDQINGDGKDVRLFGENDAREIIPERVLLPVDEMVRRLDSQRIAEDRRPAMWRRPQPDHLRPHADATVVAIDRLVGQRDVECHR